MSTVEQILRHLFFLECLCQVTEAREHNCGVAVIRSCSESSCASSKSGVPQAPGPRTPTTLWPVGHRAGRERWASWRRRNFTCIYSCSPLFAFTPQQPLRRLSILMGAPTLLSTSHLRELSCIATLPTSPA